MKELTQYPYKAYIYEPRIYNFYLNFIKENIILIKRLMLENKKDLNPSQEVPLQRCRSRHLQIMVLLSASVEYALKIILLKRGYAIQKNSKVEKFPDEFISKLEKFNKYCEKNETFIEENLEDLYLESEKYINKTIKKELISFLSLRYGIHNFLHHPKSVKNIK